MTAAAQDQRPPLWRPTPADAADWFDPAEVERSRQYKRPVKRVALVDNLVGLAFMAAVVLTHAVPRLIDALDVRAWPLQLLVGVAVLTVGGTLLGLPAAYWRVMQHDKRWELSTQTARTFWLDQVKEVLVGVVLLTVVLLPVYAVIRRTDAWWIWGTALLMGVSLIAALVYPVLIMPIFNRFTPLGDEELKDRIDAIAAKAGVTIRGSFTMDASRRSRRDNAFVAGFGPTKRVVVFDTMLEHPAHTVEQVVAHEIGHYRLQHILTMVPATLLSTLVTFGAMQWLLSSDRLLELAGVSELGDPGSLPLFVSVFAALQLLTSLPVAFLSRHHEREADLEALRLLRDPGAMVDVWKRMAPKNIADLEPSWWARLKASHPDVSERMAFATEWGRLNGVEVVAPPADAPAVQPRKEQADSAG